MGLTKPASNAVQQPQSAPEVALHRSGAVAQMLGMPVATLRVWERRYGLTRPALSPSGQRRYSAEDVRRLALVKQLTELGHAIGGLAPLDMPQLQQVAATHAQLTQATRSVEASTASDPLPHRAWRVVVVGLALGARLQRPSLLGRLGQPLQLLGPFADIARATGVLGSAGVDAVLIHEPQLHAGWLARFDALAPAWTGVPRAVLYGFAADAVCEALATAGVALLREPQPDAVVAQWLRGLSRSATTRQPMATHPLQTTHTVSPPRWDDSALVEFASRSSTIPCECPRHVAELLVQLSHFEAYSAQCAHRHAADAELHGYLQHLAGAARARFEAALEQVALHEGLMLPSSLSA